MIYKSVLILGIILAGIVQTLYAQNFPRPLDSINYFKACSEDFDIHSCYVAVRVDYGKGLKTLVLPNQELFWFLEKSRSLNENNYTGFIYQILLKDSCIVLDNDEYQSLRRLQKESGSIYELPDTNLILMDEAAFKDSVAVYFNLNNPQNSNVCWFKGAINNQNLPYMIYQLYKRHYFVFTDDMSGSLLFNGKREN